jgi:Ca-activated chloride channel family protein
MRRRKLISNYLIPTLLIAVWPAVFAGALSTLDGTVTDKQTGRPISGATVSIIGLSLKAVSDSEGRFAIPSVPPGRYTVRATHPGYDTTELTGVEILANQTTKLTIEMRTMAFIKSQATEILELVPPADALNNVQSEIAVQRADKKAYRIPRPYPGCPWNMPHPPAHGGTAIVNGQAYDAMFFKDYGTNPFVDTEDDHLSTFAVDVDDASYIMTRSYLENGQLPPDEAVRTEEFINHFKYDYAPPRRGPFAVHLEGAPSPFGENCRLLRIGIKGQEIRGEDRKPANLVFVIDVSGSMDRENRLGLVKRALRILVDQLRDQDQVGIVVFGSQGQVHLEPTSIRNRERILASIEWLQPGGSTNAEEGLRLGYRMAEQYFQPGKINRIILCSDGVANVGQTSAEELLKWIRQYAEKGITLTTVGFGMGNYNDILMEQLADKGDGFYAYVDDISQAKNIFLKNLTGSLQVIARDVKIQVDFNPATVRSYRLIGYENRDVPDSLFRDDKEDGGEIGAGHQVTALYEIKLHKDVSWRNLGTLSIRFKDPDCDEVDEFRCDIPGSVFKSEFDQCSADFKLAAAAAEFGEIIGKSYWARGSTLADVGRLTRRVFREIDSPQVAEFLDLIAKAEALEKEITER